MSMVDASGPGITAVPLSGTKQVLREAYKRRRPVLLQGRPGSAKTALAIQAALDMGWRVLVFALAGWDPVDARGFPTPDKENNRAIWLPFGDLEQALNATEPTLIVLDDLGAASPAVQASVAPLIHDDSREINGRKLPDCVTIVATTNLKGDKSGAVGILDHIRSRFYTCIEVLPDVASYIAWLASHGGHPTVTAFLKVRGADLLCAPKPNMDCVAWPNLRTWQYFSDILTWDLDKPTRTACLMGAVGREATEEYLGFISIAGKCPTLQEIVTDPRRAMVPIDGAVLYAASAMIADGAKPEHAEQIFTYLARLPMEQQAFTMALFQHRNKGMINTAAYRDWAVKNQAAF